MHFKVVYDARAMTRRLHIYKCIYRYSYIYNIYIYYMLWAYNALMATKRWSGEGVWEVVDGRREHSYYVGTYERKILYISRSQRDWNIIRTMHKYTSTSHAFNKRPPLEIIKTHSLYYYNIYLYSTYDDDPFLYYYYKI